MQYTVYFRYRYFKDDVKSVHGELHYEHRFVNANDVEDMQAAIDLVMAEERASMIGHTGDRGAVEFAYATNGKPKDGLWMWECGDDAVNVCRGAK